VVAGTGALIYAEEDGPYLTGTANVTMGGFGQRIPRGWPGAKRSRAGGAQRRRLV